MYFSKKDAEPVQMEDTPIWTCDKEECSCWMRIDFSFDDAPTCPICKSSMSSSTKQLPVLNKH